MKITIIFCFCLLFALKISAQGAIKAEITYIGNEGFMISNNNKKVFVDALYYYSYGAGILNVDTVVRNRIIGNKEQFSNADLFLITHNHPDHYDQTMMRNYLTNNPQAKLVAQSDIVKGITSPSLLGKLIDINPVKYQSIDSTINGIPITSYNLIHNVGYRVYNVGYFADIDGLHIFHSGDNTFEDSTEYIGFKINQKIVDVAFLNYNGYWRTLKQREFVKKYINPKFIVLMHIPTTGIETTKKAVSEITDSFAPIIVFNTSMEKAKITEDEIIISNHMPVNIASMKDTTFNINTNVTIPLTDLFKDQDTDDSMSYLVSGLPTGFVFNDQERSISGKSPLEIKNRTIIITARDRNFCANSTYFKMTIQKTTGLQSLPQSEFVVYPNPVFNQLNFSNTHSFNASVTIFNLEGKQVLSKQVVNGQVDISNLSNGIYTFRLNDDANIRIGKLVKQ